MKNQRPVLLVLVVSMLGLASACSEKPAADANAGATTPPATPPATPTPTATPPAGGGDPAAEAKQIFATRCTPCHGATGGGDGPGSAGLTPKPAAFNTPAWQSSVTDEHIEKIIAYGGMAVGKSAAMPPNPDLADKPVIPELRKLIRSFKPAQ